MDKQHRADSVCKALRYVGIREIIACNVPVHFGNELIRRPELRAQYRPRVGKAAVLNDEFDNIGNTVAHLHDGCSAERKAVHDNLNIASELAFEKAQPL